MEDGVSGSRVMMRGTAFSIGSRICKTTSKMGTSLDLTLEPFTNKNKLSLLT
jgi:hypothetical protein